MDLIIYLIVLAIWGLFIGALGRLALPGPDPMSLWMTMGIGIVASWVAGLIMYAVSGGSYGAGIPVSALVATLFVYLLRRRRGGSLTDPGLGARRRRW
jgi:uncharacterized protein (TIGR03382 family)